MRTERYTNTGLPIFTYSLFTILRFLTRLLHVSKQYYIFNIKIRCFSYSLMLGFMTARLCCGGYHANHHLTCLMTTIINYIVFLVLTYFLGNSSLSIFTLAIAAASFILVFIFAPVEHEYNPLSPAEKKRHRIRSRLLVSIYLCLSVILILNGLFTDKIFSIGFGIFSVAVSLITAKIQCALKKRIYNKTANKVSGYENRAV